MNPRIVYRLSGYEKQWINENGSYHREDGPAIIKYNNRDEPYYYEWRMGGMLHNENHCRIL